MRLTHSHIVSEPGFPFCLGWEPRAAIANLTAPRARFFLWRRKPVPSVERRVYRSDIDGLDPRGDYWISFAVPGSDYYDLHRGQFFPFFAQIKDELNLMTVTELQENTQALRMTNPELFERPEPIVKKRFGSGGALETTRRQWLPTCSVFPLSLAPILMRVPTLT